MKTKIIIFIFLFLTFKSFSQELIDTSGNFTSQNSTVYWTHKFEKIFTFQDLLISVKKAGILNNIDIFQNTIVGQSVESFMDYRGAGFTRMSTPIILSNSSYKSFVTIENFSDGYIVTVKKITFINQNDTKQISPLFGSAQGEITPIEAIAIKKTGKFTNSFLNQAAKIIDFTLKKNYTF